MHQAEDSSKKNYGPLLRKGKPQKQLEQASTTTRTFTHQKKSGSTDFQYFFTRGTEKQKEKNNVLRLQKSIDFFSNAKKSSLKNTQGEKQSKPNEIKVSETQNQLFLDHRERKRLKTQIISKDSKSKYFAMKNFTEKKIKQIKNDEDRSFHEITEENIKKSISPFKLETKSYGLETKRTMKQDKMNIVNKNPNKMLELQMRNITLQQQNKNLEYQLQIMNQDKNILISHIQAIEAELEMTKTKVKENKKKQEDFKVNEIKLKQKIEELEERILMSKGEDKKSKDFSSSGCSDSESLVNDKELIQRKNQEISRLNEIINKTRERVCDLNKNLSEERMKNVKNIHKLKNENQEEISRKQKEISELQMQVYSTKKTIKIPAPTLEYPRISSGDLNWKDKRERRKGE